MYYIQEIFRKYDYLCMYLQENHELQKKTSKESKMNRKRKWIKNLIDMSIKKKTDL